MFVTKKSDSRECIPPIVVPRLPPTSVFATNIGELAGQIPRTGVPLDWRNNVHCMSNGSIGCQRSVVGNSRTIYGGTIHIRNKRNKNWTECQLAPQISWKCELNSFADLDKSLEHGSNFIFERSEMWPAHFKFILWIGTVFFYNLFMQLKRYFMAFDMNQISYLTCTILRTII